jgi:hypothetical protein
MLIFRPPLVFFQRLFFLYLYAFYQEILTSVFLSHEQPNILTPLLPAHQALKAALMNILIFSSLSFYPLIFNPQEASLV